MSKVVKFREIYDPQLKISSTNIEFIFPYRYDINKLKQIQKLSYQLINLLPLKTIEGYFIGIWKKSRIDYNYYFIELINNIYKLQFCDSYDGIKKINNNTYIQHLTGNFKF